MIGFCSYDCTRSVCLCIFYYTVKPVCKDTAMSGHVIRGHFFQNGVPFFPCSRTCDSKGTCLVGRDTFSGIFRCALKTGFTVYRNLPDLTWLNVTCSTRDIHYLIYMVRSDIICIYSTNAISTAINHKCLL